MPPTPPILTVAEHAEGLGDAVAVIRANAVAAGLDAAVPTCPGWSVRDLVTHLGVVHRWADAVLTGRVSPPATGIDEPAVEAEARAAADVLDWLDDGLVDLVNTLAHSPDDLEAFFFLSDAPPARLAWARRQCHEATVHAVDAMSARLRRPPTAAETWIRPRLAADGIDELLTGFLPRRSSTVRSEQPIRVAVLPTDVEQAWLLDIGPGPVVTTRTGTRTGTDTATGTETAADVTLRGSAVQLYLALWNRGEEIEVDGSDQWLAGWREQMRVRWS